MTHPRPDSEDALEQAVKELFGAELGWDEVVNAYSERVGSRVGLKPAGSTDLGRETEQEVVLRRYLLPALARLNPGVPEEALLQAAEELSRERGAMSLPAANREVYGLLKEGVKVSVPDPAGGEVPVTVRVVDWAEPENNHFLLVSQFWVQGELYRRRADLVGFINGVPLLFVELKASHKRLEHAYDDNLRDYKTAIPRLLWYNAFIVLSNGSESRLGSVTAPWGHFAEWKRVESEAEAGVLSLETLLHGACERARFLDITENFILFSEEAGGLVKIVAKNHQVLGVNNAVAAVKDLNGRQGKLGVYWHTQGSGKSYSMVFFSQKVLRTVPGNWTFVVVTDRIELDDQIYGTFARAGTTGTQEVHAEDGAHLKQLLSEDHRYVFTLIQKFRVPVGEGYPTLSERENVIVMTDEAHRSQYDVFALNMRSALPNAAFIGFTGTPLLAGEEKTREVFGDYVSVYNFAQAVADGATVPLYYENRTPELQLTNAALDNDMQRLLEQVELDEAQERRLEREFAREYHLITRDERLDTVAEDLVAHFMGRGHFGKAMVIAIDKATAVRMFDKVQHYWGVYQERLQDELLGKSGEEAARLAARLAFMQDTDMAVVVSQAQNELEDFAKQDLDMRPHRERMVREELDIKFKDPKTNLRLVFVCAMWMTGFDAPSVSTIYLDKPMRNHTLMQTIARANRVWGEKNNGLIVDYVGVFRNLQAALAIYGASENDGTTPIKDKAELVAALDQALSEAVAFAESREVDVDAIIAAPVLRRIALTDDAKESLLESEETKRRFLGLEAQVDKLFKAVLPDDRANLSLPARSVLHVIAEKLKQDTEPADISDMMGEINDLLDRSVDAEAYVITQATDSSDHLLDLAKLDIDKLKAAFEGGRKRTEAEKLRRLIAQKLEKLVAVNRTRMNYHTHFQKMVDDWNAGAQNVEGYFQGLLEFTETLTHEEERHLREGLSEEELAVFDLLTRADLPLGDADEKQVKGVAQTLLATLQREKLKLDWRKYQQSRADVKVTIERLLDEGLPEVYDTAAFEGAASAVYEHVFEQYGGDPRA